jgi:hypothetical protein
MQAAPRLDAPLLPIQRYALILLLAWLPSLAFVGHWESLAAPLQLEARLGIASHPGHAGHAPAPPEGAPAEHEQHCHSGFDSCSTGASGMAMPIGAAGHTALAAPDEASVPLALERTVPASPSEVPPTPPPRSLP